VAATIIIILDRTACIDYRLIWQSCRLSGSESEAARMVQQYGTIDVRFSGVRNMSRSVATACHYIRRWL
jgi:hypothetical protein